jgi:hypothetical protein
MLTEARIMAIVPTTDIARAKAFYVGRSALPTRMHRHLGRK